MSEQHTHVPTPQESVAQLKRMLAVARFKTAAVQAKLLRFVVTQTLARKELNETTVGLAIFKNYDPASHKVRQNAWLLRNRIHDYYAHEGCSDLVKITLSPGGYLATFSYNVQSAVLRKYIQSLTYRRDITSMYSWAMAQSLLLDAIKLSDGKYAPAHAVYAENNLIRVLLHAVFHQEIDAINLTNTALLDASIAADIDPNSWFAHTIKGVAFLFRFQHAKAKSSFDTALRLGPSSTRASLWYATYLMTTGDTEGSLQIARSQVNEHPGSFEVRIVYALFNPS